MPGEPRELRGFISNYQNADESRIRFDWNGKHGDEFVDANGEFRGAVAELVVSEIDEAPLELVRDLFKAATECSREAWFIEDFVGTLAERLLRSDPERFLEDYLKGKFQSFDADCGTVFTTDKALAERLNAIVCARLADALPQERRELLENGKVLFESWLAPPPAWQRPPIRFDYFEGK